LTTLGLSLLLILFSGTALGQCILANPSFEVGGSGGPLFGGWDQFGVIGTSPNADHGSAAARVVGPNRGGWDVSGFWQSLDTTPGEQWEATVRLMNDGANPLSGASIAMVNIEWRDSGDALIGYESHTAANANSPIDTWLGFSVVSGPAPSGAVSVRLLLGVLQSPTDPSPTILYDTATFYSLDSPTMDEQQWFDYPGGRVIDFAGYSWRVKGDGYYEPGPSSFSDDPDNIWVDGEGQLHLTIRKEGTTWYSTEVALEDPLGYGDYIFTTEGRLDALDPQAVLGLFLWQYGPCWDSSYLWWNPFNEIDVEFSRWGDPGNDIGHFTAQPFDWVGNGSSYDAMFAEGEITSHAFRWLSDRVEFRSWRGGPWDESPATTIHAWTYTGPHIPRPEQPRVHLNFWYIFGAPATDQEALLNDFTFIAENAPTSVGHDPRLPAVPGPAGRLYLASPNPFNPRTEIRYALDRAAETEIAVYDLRGRLVRTLVSGFVPAGEHLTCWDGNDDAGVPQASGVYFYRLQTSDYAETKKMTLLK
jgi:hypothetical protein